jgi:hypothetical protein
VILQLTCLVGLWGYLQASLIDRRAMALIQVTVFFSGLTIFNAFFTWPKLLPVAFLFVIAGYLLTDRYHSVRSDWRIGAITGCATAFAALCHGGSAFAIIGLAATMLALRRLPGARFILAASLSAAILYSPWTLYQKYYDPPGDRLLKWHLAGTIEPEPHITFSRLLAANYEKLSWKQIADAKVANFEHVLDTGTFWKDAAAVVRSFLTGDKQKRAAAVAMLRWGMFIYWIQSLDLFSLTPLAFIIWLALRRRKSTEIQQAWLLWLCTAITLVVWCLLMFIPASTHAYQGSYFTELTAFSGGALALWAISQRLAVLAIGCHIVFNLAVYVFLPVTQPVGAPTFMGPANLVLAGFGALSALAFLWLSWQMSKSVPPHGLARPANAGQERAYVAI